MTDRLKITIIIPSLFLHCTSCRGSFFVFV